MFAYLHYVLASFSGLAVWLPRQYLFTPVFNTPSFLLTPIFRNATEHALKLTVSFPQS